MKQYRVRKTTELCYSRPTHPAGKHAQANGNLSVPLSGPSNNCRVLEVSKDDRPPRRVSHAELNRPSRRQRRRTGRRGSTIAPVCLRHPETKLTTHNPKDDTDCTPTFTFQDSGFTCFLLSLQSTFHLSLALLVRYRSETNI